MAEDYERVRRNERGVSAGIGLRSARGPTVLNPRMLAAGPGRGRSGRGLTSLLRATEAAPADPSVAAPRLPTRLVPSAEGPLGEVLLSYPAYADARSSHQDTYADLVETLPSGTRFTILVHRSVRDELEVLLAAAGATDRSRLVEVPDYLHFLVWTQDPFLAVTSGSDPVGTGTLVEPVEFARAADSLLADLLMDALPFMTDQSPLPLEGGNTLAGDDFVLLGADTLLRTRLVSERFGHLRVPPGESLDDLTLRIFRDTVAPGMDVHVVGLPGPLPPYRLSRTVVDGRPVVEELGLGLGRSQPIFHLDMFVTLAGRDGDGAYRVLVGDPAMADTVLGRRSVPHSLAWAFDEVAARLRRQGLRVIRNPLPLTYVDYPGAGPGDPDVRSWYFASSNNCLVQVDRSAGNRVWLPTYGHGDWRELRRTDAANADLWASLGFDVVPLGDYHRFAQNLGAVHCITNCYRRQADDGVHALP
jgi:hypothetical protein